jgi:phage-related protein
MRPRAGPFCDACEMARMHAVYYRTSGGLEPVNEFIDALPPRHQASLDLQIDRLNDLRDTDPPLPFPHSSQVQGELRELRCHYGRQLYRVLYRRSERFFVLLHVLEKRTGVLPASDISIAQSRWRDFKRRMNEQPRRRPRAIGHDAP